MPVIDNDLGGKKIEALMGKEVIISLGFLGEKADARHSEGKVTVIDVATWFTFGTSKIPPRDPLGTYYDAKEPEIVEDLKMATLAIIDAKADLLQALQYYDAVGAFHVGGVQAMWASPGFPPELSDVTLELREKFGRGSLTKMPTGIVTGQLRSSVTFKTEFRTVS
jgi:hypothetical protein